MDWQADLDEETIDWRAVCGKTARTVRREGKVKTFLYPYHQPFRAVGNRLVHSKLKYIHINLGAIQDQKNLVNNNHGEQNFKLNRILDRAKIDN